MLTGLTGVLVLVASPGDVPREREALRNAMTDWNIDRGRREGVVLLPWLWERHAVPRLGDRPQAIINAQAVDAADIVVAILDGRLGTSTGVDVSGTAEEIGRAVGRGRPVHVYFSSGPLPREVDPDQLVALQAFQKNLERDGVLGRYEDPRDLAAQVLRAVEADLVELARKRQPIGPGPSGASLQWSHEQHRETSGSDGRGAGTGKVIANDLILKNAGDADAEDLRFTVEPVGGTRFVFSDPPMGPVTVPAHSTMSWTLIPTGSAAGGGRTVIISARWQEDGAPREAVRTIRLAGR